VAWRSAGKQVAGEGECKKVGRIPGKGCAANLCMALAGHCSLNAATPYLSHVLRAI